MFSRPPSATDALTPLLDEGEDLLWYDQPSARSLFGSQWVAALVGLAITAFAVSWLVMAVQSGAPAPVLFVGIGFTGGGLFVASAPIRKPHEAKFIYYAITSRRLIIAQLWGRRKVRSFKPNDIQDVETLSGDEGLSDVVFGRTVSYVREETDQSNEGPTRIGITKKIKLDGFFGIRDGERVAQAVKALKESRTEQD